MPVAINAVAIKKDSVDRLTSSKDYKECEDNNLIFFYLVFPIFIPFGNMTS